MADTKSLKTKTTYTPQSGVDRTPKKYTNTYFTDFVKADATDQDCINVVEGIASLQARTLDNAYVITSHELDID